MMAWWCSNKTGSSGLQVSCFSQSARTGSVLVTCS